MGIANVGASSGATCAIATDVPTEGFTGGSSHHHGAAAKNAGELFGQIAARMEYMSVFFYI